MGDIVRELKVSELNRILPMVRKTIEKERRLNKLEYERDKSEDELEKVNQVISTLENMPLVLEFSNSLKNFLSEGELNSEIDAQNQRKNELIESINNYNAEIDELTKQWKFETKLYCSITSVIATDGGFLQSGEIQIEFLPEYLYLLVIDTSFRPIFTLKRLISFEIIDVFFDLISDELSNPYSNDIVSSLKYELFDKAMYFSCFK